ncbi:ABC transporter ATP-binding protein [Pseudoflavonifractor capillosus]|uniref:ABC transporter ATP-binding protein n=1 Tax=Pseudoflavonifractor capillosus TaxID=106588 RepID=UPI0019575E0F|nr:ABC transporter ATP-binding protein [Pseudoflavonifractor capillosus]MBM6694104.1 ABC transporter ATP-binding protein [Pseudoflavonifractor capillosus]
MRRYIFGKNKLLTATMAVVTVMHTAAQAMVALMISRIIDTINEIIFTGNTGLMANIAILCVVFALFVGVVVFTSMYIQGLWIKKIMLQLKNSLFHGMLHQPMATHQNRSSAEDLTLLTQSVGTFEENYLKNSIKIFESALSIVMAVVLLFTINPMVAIISIVSMCIPTLLPQLFSKKMARRQGEVVKQTTDYTGKVKDALTGYEVLKTYHAEPQNEAICRDQADAMESSKLKMTTTNAMVYSVANISSVMVQLFIMLLAGIFAVRGLISLGNILAVVNLTSMVVSPAFEISGQITQLKSTQPIVNQMLTLLNISDASAPMSEVKRSIVLDNVTFSYADAPVLAHASAQFEQGKKYAIIGKSGSGKSTLLKLLAGYYNDFDGNILVDGQADMQCDCAVIHQNVFLFDDTIRNNITLHGDYTDAQVQAAVHAAGLDEVVADLPEGLETNVSENGARFSGGERQRIAIARALLHKKSLLLVDEATSALDAENAAKIEDSILSLKGITCIAVTHKSDPKILARYDQVLRMENGMLSPERKIF